MVDTIALSILATVDIVKTALLCITFITIAGLFVRKIKPAVKEKCGCEFCETQDKHETNKEVK